MACAFGPVVVSGASVGAAAVAPGGALGVGVARGIGALNLGVVGRIFLSWVVTLPVGAALSIMLFFLFKGIFG